MMRLGSKIIVCGISGLVLAFLAPAVAFAHVSVSPSDVQANSFVIFHISVPNERDSVVTQLQLAIPTGITDVTPIAMPGWKVQTRGGDSISSIDWIGSIPVNQTADISFKARAPTKATTLVWKTVQTYADGTVTHWNQPPTTHEHDDGETMQSAPYSITIVSSDSHITMPTQHADVRKTPENSQVAGIALLLCVITVTVSVYLLTSNNRRR